jgi:hypothetical protein
MSYAALAATCAQPSVPGFIAPTKRVGNGTSASCTESALRQALSGGGTITFSCGSAPATIRIGSELVVTRNTVIDGGGKITLDGQHRTRILRNAGQLTLKKVTLVRGRASVGWTGTPNGGGAVNSAYGKKLYVADSIFRDNQTSNLGFGGAIFQAGNGLLTVVRSRFENNVSGGGGGVYTLLAGLRMANSTFTGNRAVHGNQGGGGLMTDGGSANSGSGATGGDIVVCGSSFSSNSALADGGGALLWAYKKDRVTVSGSTFTGNSVRPNSRGHAMGGGIRLGRSAAQVDGSTFGRNTAKTGGGVSAVGPMQTLVRNSTFQCNSGGHLTGPGVVSQGNRMSC